MTTASRKKRYPTLIVGNWKTNPPTLSQARELFVDIRKQLPKKMVYTDIAIAAPTPFISSLQQLSPSHRIQLSAQDVFFEKGGSHTGEVSTSMLQSVGTSSVIVGHSERRALGDTDTEIHKNILAILKSRMAAILCVGEEKRDKEGAFFTTIESQIRAALEGIPTSKLSQIIIAYEPIWAIGTGTHASAEDVYEMKLFITKCLTDTFGRSGASKVRIIYGGSVNEKNAAELLQTGDVDGFLIGGASLKASAFVSIVKTAEAQYGKK